jgi:hypothetical protein
MFREAAMLLPDYSNGEECWPKYALLTHAIELSLKAFDLHSGKTRANRPANHDLRGWYDVALQHGLPDEPGVAQNIDLLNELHENHYARYPQDRTIPTPESIADSTVDHLISAVTRSINPR